MKFMQLCYRKHIVSNVFVRDDEIKIKSPPLFCGPMDIKLSLF